MKALVCQEKGQPLALKTVPTPTAIPGSVVVKIVAAMVDPRTEAITTGASSFTFPDGMIPCGRAVGRVAVKGVDTTSLEVGQLVLIEPFVHARDDPDLVILWGAFDGGTPASKKFTADNWAAGVFAEYCRTPLENCHALDEDVLCGSLGYSPLDLVHMTVQLVPYAGLRSIDLQAGEKIVVAPATGEFSGSAVQVAVAMGANVVAVGRNAETLKRLQDTFPAGRVTTVLNTGNVEADTEAIKKAAGGELDAYIDVSPPAAAESTHVRSCFASLRRYGRASLMGLLFKDVALPYSLAVFKSLIVKGLYMYEREQVRGLIKLVETGAVKVGKPAGIEIVGTFKLEEIDQALKATAAKHGIGYLTVLTP